MRGAGRRGPPARFPRRGEAPGAGCRGGRGGSWTSLLGSVQGYSNNFQYVVIDNNDGVDYIHPMSITQPNENAINPNAVNEVTLGGNFTFPGTPLTIHRMGYGAMQLAGPGVFGPPKDPEGAVAVLREAVAAGVNHIDTSDFYGPHVTNQIIRRDLHPYPAGLVIVTKLGARRPPDKSWQPARSPRELTAGVHDTLRNLGLDALDIVNYRVMGSGHGTEEGSIAEQLTALADLRRQG